MSSYIYTNWRGKQCVIDERFIDDMRKRISMGYFRQPAITRKGLRENKVATTSMNQFYNEPLNKRGSQRALSNLPAATHYGIALLPIYWKTAMTSERSKNCWGTEM